MVKYLVKLRTDLLDMGIQVPIGNVYYFGTDELEYRWLNEDCFQICYQTEWLEADSIDWDFFN